MAAEQEVILRRNGQSVAHEGAGVEDQSAGHAAGYAILSPCKKTGRGAIERCALSLNNGGGREGWEGAYISGSFCVSITAAIGMPKLETGPQKSVGSGHGQSVIRGVRSSVGEMAGFRRTG